MKIILIGVVNFSQEIFFGDKIHLLLRSKTSRRNLVYHEPVLFLIVWIEKVTVL